MTLLFSKNNVINYYRLDMQYWTLCNIYVYYIGSVGILPITSPVLGKSTAV